MLDMLDFLATIASNVLSLPGVLGLGLGMMTRNVGLGAALGAIVGLVETFIFADFAVANISPLELGIAVAVGACAGSLGTGIRRIGATV